MNRRNTLLAADTLITGDRQGTHGDALSTHTRIGRIWGAILGVDDIDPAIVALMMTGLKAARAAQNLTHEDNYIDLAGYAALAGEIATQRRPK